MINKQKVDTWWECKQCHKQFEVGSRTFSYAVGEDGYYCGDCLKSGITWAIAMAYKDARNSGK